MGVFTSSNSSSVFGKRSQADLNTIEGLYSYAKEKGLQGQADAIIEPNNKLGTLQRIGSLFGSLNPANALLTGAEKGFGSGVVQYGKDILTGIGSAVTGRQLGGERRYFADVAEKMGIENGIAKFGIGFLGDVLLDPSTYFGGAIVRGISAGAKIGAKATLKGVGKFAPQTEAGLRMAGEGLQDAFGRAFVAGYKASKGAFGDLLSSMSEKSRALNKVASEHLANLGVKGLTTAQIEEVGLKASLGKQAEFLLGEKIGGDVGRTSATSLIREAFKTGDWTKVSAIDQELAGKINVHFDTPQQMEYFTKLQARALDFAKQAGIEDPYAVYMPFLRKEVRDKFVAETSKAGVRIGSRDYLKEFKNILNVENIEKNPAVAFLTREEQIINDVWAKKTLEEFVQKYGKPIAEFASEDEARQAGFRMLKTSGGFGKPVGWVGEWDAKLFNDLIRPEFQTISMLARATGFDAITGLFKRSVTGIFLPFHVRNFVSGLVQNFEVLGIDALNPRNISMGWKLAKQMAEGDVLENGSKILNIGGKEMTAEEVFRPLFKRFSDDTQYHLDYESLSGTPNKLVGASKIFSKERLKETIKTGGLSPESIPFKSARVVGQFIEHQQKATAYVTALGQGKTIEEALALAEKSGFDYRALTAFESQVMRRLVPFYSYARKNIELQLRVAGENPQRINQIMRFFANNPLQLAGIEPGTPLTPEEKQALPAFLKESLGPQLEDTPEGLKQFVSSFGTPIESFAQIIGDNQVLRGISMMNPLLKVPIEIGIGKDSFRKNDIKENYSAKEYSAAPQIVKDLLQLREVKKDILRKNGSGKLVKVGEKIVYSADPIRLLIARALPTSRGVSYLDQIFDGDLNGFIKYLNLTTGVKAQQVDTQMQVGIQEKKIKEELQDMLRRQTDLRKLETVYEPK